MRISLLLATLVVLGLLGTWAVDLRTPFYDPYFMIEGEGTSIELEDHFEGHNIKFTVLGLPEFVRLPEKFGQLGEKEYADIGPFTSWYLEKDASGRWISDFAIISKKNELWIGILTGEGSVPILDTKVVIPADEGAKCFGVTRVRKDVFVVDCASKTSNKMYFVAGNSATQMKEWSIVKVFTNPATIEFESLFNRRITMIQTGNGPYVLRVHKVDDLAKKFYTNTFVEVYRISDDLHPSLIDVVDRSSFGLSQLSIIDYKIFNHEIFLVDRQQGIFRVSLDVPEIVLFYQFTSDFQIDAIDTFTESVDGRDRFSVVAATPGDLVEIDWTDPESPFERMRIKNPVVKVLKVDMNARYIVSMSEVNNGISIEVLLHIFRRDSEFPNKVYYTELWTEKKFVSYELDEITDTLLIFGQEPKITARSIGETALIISNAKFGEHVCDLTITDETTKEPRSLKIKLRVLPPDDLNIYQYQHLNVPDLFINHPNPGSCDLDPLFYGPAINYDITVDEKFANSSVTVNDLLPLDLNLVLSDNKTIDPKDVIFTHFQRGDSDTIYRDNFIWLIQVAKPAVTPNGVGDEPLKPLHFFVCSIIDNKFPCQHLWSYQLTSEAIIVQLTKRYVVIKTKAEPLRIDFYSYTDDTKPATWLQMYNVLDECFDIVIQNYRGKQLLYCPQRHREQIEVYDANFPSFVPLVTLTKWNILTYDDQSHESLRFFSPERIILNENYPNFIFVKCLDRIAILNIAMLEEKFVIIRSVVATDATMSLGAKFDVAVTGDYMMIISQSKQTIQQFGIQQSQSVVVMRNLPSMKYKFSSGRGAYAFTSDNNMLFIRGEDEAGNSHIIAYHTARMGMDAVFKDFDLGHKITGRSWLMADDTTKGYDVLIEVSTTGMKAAKFMRVATVDVAGYPKDMDKDKIDAKVNVRVSNKFSKEPLPLIVPVHLFNSKPEVQKKGDLKPKVDGNAGRHYWSFNPTDYVEGAIVDMIIKCGDDKCASTVLPVKALNKTKSLLPPDSETISSVRDVKDFIVAQTFNQLILLNRNNPSDVLDFVDLADDPATSSNPDYRCKDFVMHESSEWGVALCIDESKQMGYIILVSFLQYVPKIVDKYLHPMRWVNNVALVDKYFFFSDTPENAVLSTHGNIHIFRIDFSIDPEQSVVQQLKSIDNPFSKSQITSFTALHTKPNNNTVLLFITEATLGLKILRLDFNPLMRNYYTVEEIHFGLKEWLRQHEGIPEQTVFKGVGIIGYKHDATLPYVELVVVTKNWHHYEIGVYYTDLTKNKLLRIHQKYGPHDTGARFAISDKYFIVYGSSNNGAVSPAAYHIYFRQRELGKEVDDDKKKTLIKGSIIPPFNQIPEKLRITAMEIMTRNKEDYLYLGEWFSDAKLAEYRIAETYGVNFTDVQAVKDHDIELLFVNDVSAVTYSFKLSGSGGSGGSFWVWFFIIVLLAGLGFGGYYFKRRYNILKSSEGYDQTRAKLIADATEGGSMEV